MKTRANTFSAFGVRPFGFTLVELLVVVAIVALTLGVLLPTLGDFLDSTRVSDARNLISANLAGARNYAVANNIATALVFEADDVAGGAKRTLMFFAEQNVTNPGLENTAVVGRKNTPLPNNIVVSANKYGELGFPDRTVAVCFLPTGQLTQMDGSVADFYLYDFAVSDEDLQEHLYINYYTGTVIEE